MPLAAPVMTATGRSASFMLPQAGSAAAPVPRRGPRAKCPLHHEEPDDGEDAGHDEQTPVEVPGAVEVPGPGDVDGLQDDPDRRYVRHRCAPTAHRVLARDPLPPEAHVGDADDGESEGDVEPRVAEGEQERVDLRG